MLEKKQEEPIKVGYTFNKDSKEKLGEYCDSVYVEKTRSTYAKSFELFVKHNTCNEIIILSQKDAGLQIGQMYAGLEVLKEAKRWLKVIDKGNLSQLTDQEYFEVVYELASTEKELVSQRTKKGLEEAVKKGRIPGRPKVTEEVVERIQFLYSTRHKTIRQIATICNVSVGTAYKYATLHPSAALTEESR